MKTVLLRIMAVAALVLSASSCGNVHKICVTSCNVASISPNGLRSVDAVLRVGVHNPAMTFTVTDVVGCIYGIDGTVANFDGGPVTVLRHSDDVHEVPCSLTLDGKLSLFEILSLVRTMDLSAYKMDVIAHVKVGALTKVYEYKELPLKDLLKEGNIGLAL